MKLFQNIYLSDDDTDDVEFFTDAVNEICTDCRLTVSHNGEELLSQLSNCEGNFPDVIFIDVNMPKMGGIQALDSLRAIAGFKKVPVVIYSTSPDTTYIDQAYAGGAHFYFVKPFNFADLRTQINGLLSRNWNHHLLPTPQRDFVLNT